MSESSRWWEQVPLWDRINDVVEASGGNRAATNDERTKAVVAVNRAVEELTNLRLAATERKLADAQREAAQLRRIAIDAVNETDGWCREDVSIAFLCGLANEVAGIKKQRDEARRRLATRDAHVESMLQFISEAHDYLRGKGNPDLPAWVLSAMAQEVLDCVPMEISDPSVEVSE